MQDMERMRRAAAAASLAELHNSCRSGISCLTAFSAISWQATDRYAEPCKEVTQCVRPKAADVLSDATPPLVYSMLRHTSRTALPRFPCSLFVPLQDCLQAQVHRTLWRGRAWGTSDHSALERCAYTDDYDREEHCLVKHSKARTACMTPNSFKMSRDEVQVDTCYAWVVASERTGK